MRAHVMTRGASRDYAFLGSAPADQWWRDYSRLTAFEQPSLLVNADETGWRLYASAIPSARRDRTNTRIRFTVVLAGEHDSPPEHLGGVVELVRSWLRGRVAVASDRLVALLDDHFPADETERLLAAAGPANDEDVGARVRTVLQQLTSESDLVDPQQVPQGLWVGDVADQDARQAFVHQAESLLRGDAPGWAVQLNLAGEKEIRRHFEQSRGPLAALVDDRVVLGRSDLAPKAPSPSAVRNRQAVVLVAVAALVLAGIAGLVIWSLAQNGPSPVQPTAPPVAPTSGSTLSGQTDSRGSCASPQCSAPSAPAKWASMGGWLALWSRFRDGSRSVCSDREPRSS